MYATRRHDIIRSTAGRLALAALLLAAGSPLLAAGDEGFLYGRVTTTGGSTYVGRLRWGGEEAFWGDFFNGTKRDRTYADEVPESKRTRREPVKIFGITVRWGSTTYDRSRVFKARFGDIQEIRVRSGDSATLLMKTGSEYRVDGGSNDLGGEIQVWDDSIGEVTLDWKRIEKIEFLDTPKRLDVGASRLYGTVRTTSGDFRGFVQWDQDECLSVDALDGDSDDANLSIEMGKIRSIERRSSRSVQVVLRDDREFVLDGSNDVNSSNRGVFVDDPRFGRVLVHWDAFERIDFGDAPDSGPAYDEFAPTATVRATVTDRQGRSTSGRIVYDLDESESWEFIDGSARDIDYVIPLAMIASIEPRDRHSSVVRLRNGEEVELSDAADVDDGSDGVLILSQGDRHTYFEWDEIRRIDFD
jgi:hypothetical protein